MKTSSVSPKLLLSGCSITATEKKGSPPGNEETLGNERGLPLIQGIGVAEAWPTPESLFHAGSGHCGTSYLGQGCLNLPFTYSAKHTSSSQSSQMCSQPSHSTSLLPKVIYPPSPTGEILFNLFQCLETMLAFLLQKEEDADSREQSAGPSKPQLQRLPKAEKVLVILISFCVLLVLSSLLWFRGYMTQARKKFCLKFCCY